MFSGGTIFLDHVSQFIDLHCQVTLGATDTFRSKELHEMHAAE